MAFHKEQQTWMKCVLALSCLKNRLDRFIDEETGIFYEKLRVECGAKLCEKNCNLNNWKPQPNQSPPLDCEVCSSWIDAILANHTSPHGKVMWMNSEPNLWSQDKWEVAKVYMPGGHKNHHCIAEFDIAAHLCFMKQCKHFQKFELGGLCDDVANVRNNIMHSPNFQLEPEDLLDYFNRIKKLGQVLEKHIPDFKILSDDIDEILGHNYRLVLPDNMADQKSHAQDEKQLEDIFLRGTMATPIEVFLTTMERLKDREFKRFKWWLLQQEVLKDFPAIRVSELENADREDTVDQMVKNYSINTIKVIWIVLEKMRRKDLMDMIKNHLKT